MTDKNKDISINKDIPVIFVEDSPEYEKRFLTLSKKTGFEKKREEYSEEDEKCLIVDHESKTSSKKTKIDINNRIIIDLSSSCSDDLINEQNDKTENLYLEDQVKKDYTGPAPYSLHTLSILSTIDEFSLNIMKSTSILDSKDSSKNSNTSSNSKLENSNSKDTEIINQKMLENKQVRKKSEKKRSLTLRHINKLKISKKECLKEIIVNIDKNILSSPMGPILSNLLKNSDCEFNEWVGPIPNLIFWKRKVVSEYDEKLGYFVPIPETIQSEKHILVYMKASELLKIESDSCVDELVNQLTKEFPGSKIIYMIESIDALLRKIKNDRNRRYVNAIRATIETNNSKSVFMPSEEIEEKIENIMLRLQLIHNVLIVNTSNMENSAEWIFILTGDISTIPYKKIRLQLSSSFCMESGQIKTGIDIKDTYIKLLQTIHKVTPQIANIIVQKYPKISNLTSAFIKDGPDILSDLIGNLMKRKIGPVLSRRIYHAFMISDSTASAI
ncbi:hypothetical protein PCANB_000994 [Pneumocystis canis]|nr:hypothetical protein PCANB_000994 [Pneumocystis canis]